MGANNGRTNGDKAALRLMRFLGKGRATCRQAAGEGRVLIEIDGAGAIGAERDVLAGLARRGLVAKEEGGLELSPAGRAFLKRALAADDGYLEQHRDLDTATVEMPVGRQVVTVNHDESPLAQLCRRRTKAGAAFLSAEEFAAGERLRADYTRGRIMARTGVNWQAVGGSGGRRGDVNGIADLTDAALAARQRVERAIEAVGPELSGVLIDVCCFLKGLELVESERGWPVRSAKIVLKSALGVLSRHYQPPRAGRPRKPMLHWGAPDYRPSLRP